MSRYFSNKYASLVPYTPGEQPQEMPYIKLNTNESPFPPSEKAQKKAEEEGRRLQLYSDPTCRALNEKAAEVFHVDKDELLFTNGSDEILNFAFMAFCDEMHPAVFADVTYGFYSVFAALNNIPTRILPLDENFRIRIEDYFDANGTVFIANPNAPTGIALSDEEIEEILLHNKDNVVVIDEAYVDFGAESCLPLIHKYDNLLVTQTFSKSRSMAGARLGFGAACKELIADLNTVKYSTNPYNINRMTMAAGIGALEDEDYTKANCRTVMENRAWTAEQLASLGFTCLPSQTNFIFASHPEKDGGDLYRILKARGILVRHFDTPRLKAYNRITVGSKEQMETLIDTLRDILKG